MIWKAICKACLKERLNSRRFGQSKRFSFYPEGRTYSPLAIGKRWYAPAYAFASCAPLAEGKQTILKRIVCIGRHICKFADKLK